MMNLKILTSAVKQIQSIVFVFLVQLGLGYIIYNYASKYFNLAFGKSELINTFKNGFDRTVFSDLTHNTQELMYYFGKEVMILVVVYFFLSIFLHAGFIGNIVNENTSIKSYFKNALKLFLPYLGYVILFLIIYFLITIILWYPYTTIFNGYPFSYFDSEKPIVIIGALLLFIQFILTIIVWGLSILTRMTFVKTKSFLQSIKDGITLLKKNILKIVLIGIVLLLIHIFLFALSRWLTDLTLTNFVGYLVITQGFVLLRIFIRVLSYQIFNDKLF